MKASPVVPLPRGESLFLLLLFYLRVVNDATRWLAAGRWLVVHPAGCLSDRAGADYSRCSPPTPLLLTHTHICTHTHTLMSAPCFSAHPRLLHPADFTWTSKEKPLKQCVHIALCDTAGYYNFWALLGGNGGGVSVHVITMDCLFLLIWTLPIPLVGCTPVKLLSTLLSWNIIKACGISVNTNSLLNKSI